jgi:hypothetical protein
MIAVGNTQLLPGGDVAQGAENDDVAAEVAFPADVLGAARVVEHGAEAEDDGLRGLVVAVAVARRPVERVVVQLRRFDVLGVFDRVEDEDGGYFDGGAGGDWGRCEDAAAWGGG